MTGFLRDWVSPGNDLQHPFDAAVVMPTIVRPVIVEALRSIFAQDFAGRIQVLIGLDRPADLSAIESACQVRPANCAVQVFWPGYSTSFRHGGLTPARDGGALRTILSYMANSPYVAYLDDDNWWRPDHLRLLYALMQRADWAFSLRWFVHPSSRQPVCVDEWESVGPGRGVFHQDFGGFADPNTLMINKVACADVLPCWSQPLPLDTTGMSADRVVFDALVKRHRGAGSGEPSSFYAMNATDGLHAARMTQMGAAYVLAGQT